MQRSQFLNILFGLDAMVKELQLSLDARINQTEIMDSIEVTELHEQRLELMKMSDRVALLKYSDPNDFPSTLSQVFEKREQEFKRREGEVTRVGSWAKAADIWEEIYRLDKDIYSIIYPLEIVGKWPPDSHPSHVVRPLPAGNAKT